MNQERYGRRQSWPLLRYYPGIYLKGLRKMIKSSYQDSWTNKLRIEPVICQI